jgi:hypothetical protein
MLNFNQLPLALASGKNAIHILDFSPIVELSVSEVGIA